MPPWRRMWRSSCELPCVHRYVHTCDCVCVRACVCLWVGVRVHVWVWVWVEVGLGASCACGAALQHRACLSCDGYPSIYAHHIQLLDSPPNHHPFTHRFCMCSCTVLATCRWHRDLSTTHTSLCTAMYTPRQYFVGGAGLRSHGNRRGVLHRCR